MNLRMLIGTLLVALTGNFPVETVWAEDDEPVLTDRGDRTDVADIWLAESAPKSEDSGAS